MNRIKAPNKVTVCLLSLLLVFCIFVPASAQSAAGVGEALTELSEDHQIPTLYLSIDPAEFDRVNESEDHSYRLRQDPCPGRLYRRLRHGDP